MATSAFKSTTKRTPIGKSDDDSAASSHRSSAHRRSRSLSRFSRPIPGAAEGFGDPPPPRGKFVNTVRGSGFPEISLDDLAVEFFDSGSDVRGRSAGRSSDSSAGNGATPASQRRGRSVSRQGSTRAAAIGNDGRGNVVNNSGGGKVVPESNSRRRRSMSVVRYQVSDAESDLHNSKTSISQMKSWRVGTAADQMLSSSKPTTLNHRQGLRRSLSQRELKPNDDYSSQSSALTDDEGRDGYSSKNGIERTIRAVYTQKKAEHPIRDDVNGALYEAMRKELRYAVEEIKMELGQAVEKSTSDSDRMQSNSSHALQAASTFRRNQATNLGLSGKRTQELLAELILEEQRGKELSKIVKELLPDSDVTVDKPSRPRRRSNDRNRMSKRLTEEAEKYFEDFILNVEDTDISSLDGERSDTSSAIVGIPRQETFQSPPVSKATHVEMDGVVLPWLQWETSNDPSPQSCNGGMQPPPSTRTALWDAAQEVAIDVQDQNIHSVSSHVRWSPGVVEVPSASCLNQYLGDGQGLRYDMDDYLKPTSEEEHLFERCSQRERISSGSLLLCNHSFF